MLCGVEIVNTLTFATAALRRGAKYKSIPRFKGLWSEGNGVGCETGPVPSLERRGRLRHKVKDPSLEAQTGWLLISNKNK
jgi:hypothetical protein